MTIQIKKYLAASLLLITLSSWCLSSPLNVGFDPVFHLSTVWCAWGEKAHICENFKDNKDSSEALVPSALKGIETGPPMLEQEIATPNTRSLFYKIMRMFVTKNTIQSVLIMRFLNALMVSLVFLQFLLMMNRKIQIASLASWSFTFVPIVIATITQVTPRSWSYLSGISSWVFLLTVIEQPRKIKSWILLGFCFFLAIFSRLDGFFIVTFTSALIFAISKRRFWNLLFRYSLALFSASIAMLTVLRIFIPRVSRYTTFNFGQTFLSGHTIFQIIHLPENVFDSFGLGVRFHDLGPNVVGIIGMSLFIYVLTRALVNANSQQVFAMIGILVFIFLAMFQMTLSWPEQTGPSGIYIVQLLACLLGLTLYFSENSYKFLTNSVNRILPISLLGISHGLVLFSRMEWAVRPGSELNDTYFNLSLNGGWWWNSPIGPNVVFLIGAITFPAWLIVSWNSVSKESADINS